MNPQQMSPEYEDEINLYELWKVIVKRKKLIIGLFVIAILASAIISLLMPKIYRGEVVFRLTTLPATEFINMIDKIDTKENIKRIFPNTAHLITDVKLKEIKISRKEVSQDKLRLVIEAKNREILPKSIKEFIAYLNDIPLIERLIEERRQRLLVEIKEIDHTIARLTKRIENYDKLLKTGKINFLGFNLAEDEKSVLNLKIRRVSVQQALDMLNRFRAVEMVDKPRISENPVKPKLMLNIAIAGILSLFVGIFLAFFIEGITKMKNQDNEI
ncbi:MAG: hypothetical protein J7K20_05180 [Thermodesulfobacterium sp.]|nr:hypothetical protein [Thermodesulfobacterium sp.]